MRISPSKNQSLPLSKPEPEANRGDTYQQGSMAAAAANTRLQVSPPKAMITLNSKPEELKQHLESLESNQIEAEIKRLFVGWHDEKPDLKKLASQTGAIRLSIAYQALKEVETKNPTLGHLFRGSEGIEPKGILTLMDQAAKEMGGFKDGSYNGEGRFEYSDERNYEGTFKNGERNGRGKMIYANGDTSEGEWKAGVLEDGFKYTWRSGAEYKGAWKGNLPDGRGEMIYANGDTYQGEWVAGRPKDPNNITTLLNPILVEARDRICDLSPKPEHLTLIIRKLDIDDYKGRLETKAIHDRLVKIVGSRRGTVNELIDLIVKWNQLEFYMDQGALAQIANDLERTEGDLVAVLNHLILRNIPRISDPFASEIDAQVKSYSENLKKNLMLIDSSQAAERFNGDFAYLAHALLDPPNSENLDSFKSFFEDRNKSKEEREALWRTIHLAQFYGPRDFKELKIAHEISKWLYETRLGSIEDRKSHIIKTLVKMFKQFRQAAEQVEEIFTSLQEIQEKYGSQIAGEFVEIFSGLPITHVRSILEFSKKHGLDINSSMVFARRIRPEVDMNFLHELEQYLPAESSPQEIGHLAASAALLGDDTRAVLEALKPWIKIEGHSHLIAISNAMKALWRLNPEGRLEALRKLKTADSGTLFPTLLLRKPDKLPNSEQEGPRPAITSFSAAGLAEDNWWRLFIDLSAHAQGPEAFDKGSVHGAAEGAELGYFSAMTKAFQYLDQNIERELDLDEIIRIHDLCIGQVKSSEFALSTRTYFSKGISKKDQAVPIFKNPDLPLTEENFEELQREGLIGVVKAHEVEKTKVPHSLRMFYDRYGKVTSHDTMLSLPCERVKEQGLSNPHVLDVHFQFDAEEILGTYHTEIAYAQTGPEKLAAIARCCRALEILHMFSDANQRTLVFCVLNKLLMQNGFKPTILRDPNMFDGYLTVAQLVDEIQEGQKRVEELK